MSDSAKDLLPLPLLEATARDLRDLLARLEKERMDLDARIRAVGDNIARLERRIRGAGESSRPRRPKGENLRLVREFFARHPGTSFTMQQIAEKTELPLSSVQRVLSREPAWLRQNVDGLWELVEAPKAAVDVQDEEVF